MIDRENFFVRICFVSEGSLNEYGEAYGGGGADVVCLSFSALGLVSYERELKGETSLFEDVALLSKEGKNVVVCGCYTDARGIKRKSVVVAERGRILGVSDMVNRIDGDEYGCGAGVKLYDTAAGKIGVVVAEDFLFPQVLETLALSGADIIVAILEEVGDNLEQTLMRTWAFVYGVPVCVCAYGYAQAADIAGRLCFASPQSPCLFEPERAKEYHLVETRSRGLSRREKREF